MERLKILIADDYLDNRLLLKQIIELLGHDYAMVENGRDAIQQFNERNFDFIFMDIEMPLKNGLDAAIEIRNSGSRGENIPIVAITAHNTHHIVIDNSKPKFNEIILKPYTFTKIQRILKKYFKSHEDQV